MAPVADSGRDSAGTSTLYKKLENPALVKALAHPLRAKILHVLEEQEASPKELALHLNSPLPNVAYHVQVLRKMKLIRLSKKLPRRGAVAHYYTADRAMYIDDQAWSQTPRLIKERMLAAVLEEVGRYTTEAASAGGFDHDNAHLSRSRLILDPQAWDLLSTKIHELHELGYQLHKESAKRLKRADHAGERHTGVVLMLFESKPAVPNPDDAKRAVRGAGGRAKAKL